MHKQEQGQTISSELGDKFSLILTRPLHSPIALGASMIGRGELARHQLRWARQASADAISRLWPAGKVAATSWR